MLSTIIGGIFILSPTAGPFDESPPQNLIDNYVAFMEAAAENDAL